MSGSATIGTEQAVLGHTLGFAQMPFPGVVYVGLCAMAPVPSETTGGAEVSGGNYVRAQATFALVDTPANIAANVASVEYPIATASWGTIGYFELWDSAAGGNRLYWGNLLDPVALTPITITVMSGDITRFSAGALAVQAAATGSPTGPPSGAYVPLAGGTMTGALILAADPTTALGSATKQYVDGRLGAGLWGSVVNVLDHGAYGDGVHDDTVAIQNTLTSYGGKSTVFVPNTGSPFMVKTLTPPSNTSLLIAGTLKQQPNMLSVYNGGVLSLQNVTNISVTGTGTIDGNGVNQTVSGLSCIAIFQCTNVLISGVTLQNSFGWNLNVVTSTRVIVDGITMLAGASSPEFASGCTDCWIMNSYISGPTNDGGFSFYGGCVNCGAIGNIFTNAYASGCSIVDDPAQTAGCTGIIVNDNIIFNNGSTGIAVLSSGEPAVHARITISGNVLYGNNTSNGVTGTSYPSSDIWLSSCRDVVVSGNKCRGCGNGTAASYGISVGGWGGYNAAWSVSVTGNDISNQGQGSTTGVGVFLAPVQGNDILISGNHIYDDQTTPTMLHAVAGSAGPRTAIIGNHFGILGGAALSVTTLADTVIGNAQAGVYAFGAGTTVATINPQQYSNPTGVARWFAGSDATTETGSNAGMNFEIVAVADNGSTLTQAMSISRATRAVTLQGALLAAGPITANGGFGFGTVPPNYANDAAAAAGGVSIGGTYRNGSALQVRVS